MMERMFEKITIKVSCLNDYVKALLPFQQRALAQIHYTRNVSRVLLFRGDKRERPLVAKIGAIIKKYKISRPITFERDRLMTIKSMLPSKCSDWDAMVLAQHHGIETRFLDWTSNSLVALFFGLGRHDEQNCYIWILETNERDFNIDVSEQKPIPEERTGKTVIFAPHMIDSRILAQDSYMMRQVYVQDHDARLFIEPVEQNDTFRGRLHCLDIDFGGSKGCVRNELRQYGYTNDTIFPAERNWDIIKNSCDDITSQYSEVI